MGLFSRLRGRRRDGERAPLLADGQAPAAPVRKTPLPRMQLFVLCLMRLSERELLRAALRGCCVHR